jgi:hypothetical protein
MAAVRHPGPAPTSGVLLPALLCPRNLVWSLSERGHAAPSGVLSTGDAGAVACATSSCLPEAWGGRGAAQLLYAGAAGRTWRVTACPERATPQGPPPGVWGADAFAVPGQGPTLSAMR